LVLEKKNPVGNCSSMRTQFSKGRKGEGRERSREEGRERSRRKGEREAGRKGGGREEGKDSVQIQTLYNFSTGKRKVFAISFNMGKSQVAEGAGSG
jgi:hypothetical protein